VEVTAPRARDLSGVDYVYLWADGIDTFLGERFGRLASRPGGGGRKKVGYRDHDLGPDRPARHTNRNRKARNARRQLEALGYDIVITLPEDAA
jgi:hypothetical protein